MLGRHTSTLDFCDQVPTGAYALNESHSVMAAPGFQGLTWKEVLARLKRFPRVVQQVGFAMHRGTVSCLVRVFAKKYQLGITHDFDFDFDFIPLLQSSLFQKATEESCKYYQHFRPAKVRRLPSW